MNARLYAKYIMLDGCNVICTRSICEGKISVHVLKMFQERSKCFEESLRGVKYGGRYRHYTQIIDGKTYTNLEKNMQT